MIVTLPLSTSTVQIDDGWVRRQAPAIGNASTSVSTDAAPPAASG
jgi:hypothetical protein